MPKGNKTITPWELPEINNINDNDIFIITNSNVTYRVTGKSLMQYLMLVFGAGVLYMISNIDIPSGYIIQGSAAYVM